MDVETNIVDPSEPDPVEDKAESPEQKPKKATPTELRHAQDVQIGQEPRIQA